MTTELTVQAADNGMIVVGEDFVQAIENTHNADGVADDVPMSFQESLDSFIFADGEPFGIIEEVQQL